MLRNLNQSFTGSRILGMPQVGVPASAIPATGDQGASLLYNKIAQGDPTGCLYRVWITSQPASGTLAVFEDGSFTFTGADDGTYTAGERIDKYDPTAGLFNTDTGTAQFVVGAANGTAGGATLVGTSTFAAGGAIGTVASTAGGASLVGTGVFTSGTAIGTSSATAPGASLTGTGTFNAGSASGNGNSVANGASLVGAGTFSAGGASGTKSATATGSALVGTGIFSAGSATAASGSVSATALGATLLGTSTFRAGSANGANTVSGFTPSAARTVQVQSTTPNFSAGKFWDMTNPQKPQGRKDPNSTIDITFDWSEWLADMGTVNIASVVFTLTGIDPAGTFAAPTQATVFVMNGTTGVASIACKITTDSTPARIDERTVYLLVGDE